MPRTNNKCPDDGQAVRFRVEGDKHIHHGTYTDAKGFEVCNSFMCYTMPEVDYWQPDELPEIDK